MLQARLLSYRMPNTAWGPITNKFRWIDALLHQQYQRDGQMRTDGNGGKP
jgi:hypothetical protein